MIINILYNWIYSLFSSNHIYDDSDLEKDWEIIVTNTEKIMENTKADVANELNNLRKLGQGIKIRSQIIPSINSIYHNINPKIMSNILSSKLNCGQRSAIIRKYIDNNNKIWKELVTSIIVKHHLTTTLSVVLMNPIGDSKNPSCIKQDLSLHPIKDCLEKINEQWEHEKYKKNICGEIGSLMIQSSQCSETQGLNTNVLADMIWSVYLCLSKFIIITIDRKLYQSEISLLLEHINNTVISLIETWDICATISGNVNERMGQINKKWKEQEHDKKHISEVVKYQSIDQRKCADFAHNRQQLQQKLIFHK